MSTASHPLPPPAGDRLIIDLLNLPPEGCEIHGDLSAGVLDLEPGGPQPTSPIHYQLHLHRDGDRLTAMGTVQADFSFVCVRCLEPFPDRLVLDGYLLVEEITGKTQSVDLTDRVREDILLALPSHPRCDEASLEPRACPASGLFPKVDDHTFEHLEEPSSPAHTREMWGALDQLDLKDSPTPPLKPRRNR
jgi:uncharacterized protein